MLHESPFPHYGPLRPEDVRGRDDLIAELTEQVTMRRPTALLGPRRFGKTSVLGRVAADLQDAGTSIMWLDLYELSSMADVAIRLDSALSDLRGPLAEWIRKHALSLSLNLGTAKLEMSKPPRDRPEPMALVHVYLDMMVKAALTRPTVLVLDEFSSAERVDGLTGLLRTKLQHHYETVGLIFAGSEQSTMRQLFGERQQPFYAQADLITIGPLSGTTVHDLIHDGFTSTNRQPGDLAGHVYHFTAGHPHRAMELADIAWRLAEPDAPADQDLWPNTLDRLEQRSHSDCQTLYSSLSASHQRVLRLLANGESIWGSTADMLELGASAAQRGVDQLEEAGHIDTERRLIDPVFAHWIRGRFPPSRSVIGSLAPHRSDRVTEDDRGLGL